MVNPDLDAPVRIAQDSEDGPRSPRMPGVRICRSSGRMTSCLSSRRAANSVWDMLTNLVHSDPMRNPMGRPLSC
jgi:hypothetical protein